MPNWINSAASGPFSPGGAAVPNMSGTLSQWSQPLSIEVVAKQTIGFELHETATTVKFRGVFQPLDAAQLIQKPEGQRAWAWYWLHSDSSLRLNNDDVVIFNGARYRVMNVKDYSLYGYMDYHIVDDFTGSDPVVTP